jgi:deoxyadenosine/deoxycytidine kinase
MKTEILIGVVGPCGAGKTTLITGLKKYGYRVKHIAQEHSYVPYLWQRLTNPALLIFLDASFPVTVKRRRLNWTLEEYNKQQNRLDHARQHANIVINTDNLTSDEVFQRVLDFLLGQTSQTGV